MVLTDVKQSPETVRAMIREMENVDGVKYVLGLESVLGTRVPEEPARRYMRRSVAEKRAGIRKSLRP